MSQAEVSVLTTRSAQYRDYPEDLKAAVINAIEQNGGNVLATSKLFNLPRDTVNYWWHHSDRYVEIKHGKALSLADKLENLANSTADSLLEHDFSVVAARDKATVMGIAIDKMQLLRGQPTEIVENVESHKVLVLMAGALGVEEEVDYAEPPHKMPESSGGMHKLNESAIDIAPSASFVGENAECSLAGDQTE